MKQEIRYIPVAALMKVDADLLQGRRGGPRRLWKEIHPKVKAFFCGAALFFLWAVALAALVG